MGAMTEPETTVDAWARYQRQVVFQPLGLEGQKRLLASRVLLVGAGGLGSWVAELLTRAGVGRLRLVDDDRVDLTNVHRQAMYSQADAEAQTPKVEAARARLGQINTHVQVEAMAARLTPDNARRLAEGVDLIVDGTDNFATRLLINDLAVDRSLPWIMAGVVGAEFQTMTVLPGRTPCLRCVMPSAPPVCSDPNCRQFGVLGPAVAAAASLQALEAVKILSGHPEAASPWLTKLDGWGNVLQRLDLRGARDADCPCCGHGDLEFLEP